MSSRYSFYPSEEELGERLDSVLTERLRLWFEEQGEDSSSRSKVTRWISQDLVRVDGELAKKAGLKVKPSQEISIEIPTPQPLTLEPDSSVQFDILHEDDAVLVINKPAGLVVHPGAGNYEGTLVHGLLAHLGSEIQAIGDSLRPGIVHRLDKGTSGAMVVAKTETAFKKLQAQFIPPRSIHREYLALARKAPKGDFEIKGAIDRDPRDRKKMKVVPEGGKEAQTDWQVEEEYAFGVLLRLVLQTGRTHQIRVHLKSVGADIMGDPLYGCAILEVPAPLRTAVKRIGRQALHAEKLSFVHPQSGELQNFHAPIPEDFGLLKQSFEKGFSLGA